MAENKTVPDFDGLTKALQVTKRLVDATGEVILIEDEAAGIRALGFPTAGAGRWKVPPVPPELVRDNWLFEHLAIGWPSYLTWTPANPRTGEGATLVDGRVRLAERYQPRPAGPVAVDVWLSHYGTPDHHRVLAALLRRPETGIRKRTLQQTLHRLQAARLNRVLKALIEAGFVSIVNGCLTLPIPVRSLLRRPGILVSRPIPARALTIRRGETRLNRATDRRFAPGTRENERLPFAQLQGRTTTSSPRRPRRLPPRRTSAWGRSMRAKKGGYARQQQCRLLGINPTEKATMVRLARQKLKGQNEPSAPLNAAMARRRSSTTPPWLDPVQIRLKREADAAWLDASLIHQEQLRRRRG
jgi:hypothetical protein